LPFILSVFLGVIWTINLIYWLIFLKFGLSKYPAKTKNNPSISVIICAKNEVENLKINLPHWLNQKYEGDWELIIVNDRSDDDSEKILSEITHQKLSWYNSPTENSQWKGKRNALDFGIRQARYDVLLLTDADCRPLSDQWIQGMADSLGDKDIVLGVSLYEKEKGFLNAFIRLEAVWTAIQYLSFAHIGMPYMGVGRNLMYKKSLFEKIGGFGNVKTLSGDDDLLVQKMVQRGKVALCLEEVFQTSSKGKSSFSEYYVQKNRHFEAGFSYSNQWKSILAILLITNILIYIVFLFVLFIYSVSLPFVFLFVFRLLVVYFAWYYIFKKLSKDNDLHATYLIFDSSIMCLYALTPIPFIHRTLWK
jgi:glycosyltransferase involved in cell wall biosynthesis